MSKNLIAIGRSRYLYEGVRHLVKRGYTFKAIITADAYEEYDIKSEDFQDLAIEIGASFFVPKTLDSDHIATIIRSNKIRLAISANWKYTLPKSFLDLFEGGILNFHLGNLPDYKGNATVNWSIINGEKFINANVHKMDPVLDSGDIIYRKSIPITSETYIQDIIHEAEQMAPVLYENAVERMLRDPKACEVKGTSYGLRCYPRLPEDSQIDWNQTPEEISRLIRASASPYPGAYTFLNGEKIIVWKAKIVETNDNHCAVPGHVVEVKDGGNILVACKHGLLEVQEVGHDKRNISPASLIKSIRLRFKYLADV